MLICICIGFPLQATTEQVVKFIDGAMEAIHLHATNTGGQYTHEQRVIMKQVSCQQSCVCGMCEAGYVCVGV